MADRRRPVGEQWPGIYRHEVDGGLWVRLQGWHELAHGRRWVHKWFRLPEGSTRRDAIALRDRMRRDLASGRYVEERYLAPEQRPATLAEVWQTVLDEKRRLGRKQGTIDQDIQYSAHWAERIGHVQASEVDWYDVSEWWAWASAELRAPVANKALKRLRAALRRAVAMGLRTNNPAQDIKPLRTKPAYKPSEPMTVEAFRRILARMCERETKSVQSVIDDPGLPGTRRYYGQQMHVALAGVLGLRGAEVCGLKWSDVDREAMTVTLRDTKTGADLVRPLPDALLAMLDAHRALWLAYGPTEAADSEYVLPSVDGSRARATDRIKWSWRECLRSLGYPATRTEGGWTPHHLRALGVSLLYEAGGHQREVMAFVGHSTSEAHRRYQMSHADRMRELADAASAQALEGQE